MWVFGLAAEGELWCCMPMKCARRYLCGLVLAIALGSSPSLAHAAWWWPFGQDGMDYRVEVNGVDEATYAWLKELKLDEPHSDVAIETREDLERELVVRGGRMRRALEARGYYDALLRQDIREGEEPVLQYDVRPGVRAKIADVRVDWMGREPLRQVELQNLSQQQDEFVNAAELVADAKVLLDQLTEKACVLHLNVTPQVRLHEGLYKGGRRAEVVFKIDRGDKADFGPTTVQGNEDVDTEVVLRQVSWREGRCFRIAKVNETRENLRQTQLFSVVSLTYPEVAGPEGEVPMTVGVTERAFRTIRAGASFGSDVGFGVQGGWQHRNLWGGAEKLDVDVAFGQEEQELNGTLRLPAFGHDKQDLVLEGGLSTETRDAYDARTVEAVARLERKLARRWKGSLGVGARYTETQDALGENQYGLVFVPGTLEYDGRDSVLDPRKGIYASAGVTPYTETFGDGGQFVKSQLTVQGYLSAPVALSPTLALKLSGGMIYGAEGVDVPADVRFYAGGGGSVRGYGYQTLGPRVNNTPVGGSSFVVGSAEVRARWSETVGGVAFVDAGNVYDDSFPARVDSMYVGAGVGARYYTAIGPIRLDVAVPLNGEDIGAEGYAVYVSIGQSF